MNTSGNSILRLVSSFDRRRSGKPYRVSTHLYRRVATGRSADASAVLLSDGTFDAAGPRVFVVGHGSRTDVAGPANLLPRHLALLCIPAADGVRVRALVLHPERTLRAIPLPGATDTTPSADTHHEVCGGVESSCPLRLEFEDLVLEVRAQYPGASPQNDGLPFIFFPPGEQLAFCSPNLLQPVGSVVASVAGPQGGGHAIPALTLSSAEGEPLTGILSLRTRDGLRRAEAGPAELRRGVLIGRSRRCVLGRTFHENDGLSRLHALVVSLGNHVYAFDLASRYGLRDVSRPGQVIHSARLDDGVGCLVYGAGHLIFES